MVFIIILLVSILIFISYKIYSRSHKLRIKSDIDPDLKKSIERGIKDSEEGRTISHEQAKKMFRKWLKK